MLNSPIQIYIIMDFFSLCGVIRFLYPSPTEKSTGEINASIISDSFSIFQTESLLLSVTNSARTVSAGISFNDIVFANSDSFGHFPRVIFRR